MTNQFERGTAGEKPPLSSRRGTSPGCVDSVQTLVLALAVCTGVAGYALTQDGHAIDGRLPSARTSVPRDYAGVADADWSAYGRSWRGDKWSPLAQITSPTVAPSPSSDANPR